MYPTFTCAYPFLDMLPQFSEHFIWKILYPIFNTCSWYF